MSFEKVLAWFRNVIFATPGAYRAFFYSGRAGAWELAGLVQACTAWAWFPHVQQPRACGLPRCSFSSVTARHEKGLAALGVGASQPMAGSHHAQPWAPADGSGQGPVQLRG